MIKTYLTQVIGGKPKVIEGYQQLQSLLYFAESYPLQWIHRAVKGQPIQKPPKGYFETAFQEVQKLLKEDASRIADGDYPASVLTLPAPKKHLTRLGKLYLDSIAISWRRRNKKSKEFSKEAAQHLEDVPEYYRRNFHHQTDGYLSAASAELYEHQVDILFRGTAAPMRRMILWGLRDQAKIIGSGEGLKILELGCGNGTATLDLAKTFPRAKITAVDLSGPYLNMAKERLSDQPRVSLLQGDAARLDFKDATYDAVVSVFLFHELPKQVREQVLSESFRVVKSGGFVGMVDSLQLDDNPSLNPGLEIFPTEFHEPFYKNYISMPMEKLFHDSGLRNVKTRLGFVSKYVGASKP